MPPPAAADLQACYITGGCRARLLMPDPMARGRAGGDKGGPSAVKRWRPRRKGRIAIDEGRRG